MAGFLRVRAWKVHQAEEQLTDVFSILLLSLRSSSSSWVLYPFVFDIVSVYCRQIDHFIQINIYTAGTGSLTTKAANIPGSGPDEKNFIGKAHSSDDAGRLPPLL